MRVVFDLNDDGLARGQDGAQADEHQNGNEREPAGAGAVHGASCAR